jgi:hypothetical protein
MMLPERALAHITGSITGRATGRATGRTTGGTAGCTPGRSPNVPPDVLPDILPDVLPKKGSRCCQKQDLTVAMENCRTKGVPVKYKQSYGPKRQFGMCQGMCQRHAPRD